MTRDENREVINKLEPLGRLDDGEINIAATALDLAALLHPGLIRERYYAHLAKLSGDVRDKHRALMERGAGDSLDSRITALRDVLSAEYGYSCDAQGGRDDMRAADLIAVIDTRVGAPVALAILYLHAAREQGWVAHGLDIPGSFAVRMDKDGEREICDPAAGFRVMQAPDLRRNIKRALGAKAELSASYYEPAAGRAILIRLQNIVKTRQIEAEDYDGALQSVLAMRAIDPGEYRLLLDQGVLCARLGLTVEAVQVLEQYIERAPVSRSRDRHEAAMLLQQLKTLL